MLHRDLRRARSFGADAERYDRARPSYPPELVDHLLERPVRRVLDVGCGTGIAGRLFLARGCEVHGIEPDERMANLARAHGLSVELGDFESFEPSESAYDLLISAQAWHWIDPQRGSRKAASLLAPNGRVALFWNFGSFPEPAGSALRDVYRTRAPELERYSVLLGNQDSRLQSTAQALADTGLFCDIQQNCWEWTRTYTTEEWCEQLLTHSDHRALSDANRSELLDTVSETLERLGGQLELNYQTRMVSAAR